MPGGNGNAPDGAVGQRIDRYVDEVRGGLWGVEAAEKKEILDEIRAALVDKVRMSNGVEDMRAVENALADFGPPARVAAEYAKVAKTGLTRGLKLLLVFECFWVGLMAVVGLGLVANAVQFYYYGAGLDYLGQPVLGMFWVASSISIIYLVILQWRRTAMIPGLGPFAAVATLVLGIGALFYLGWDADLYMPGAPPFAVNWTVVLLLVILVIGSFRGLGMLLTINRRDAVAGRTEEQAPGRKSVPRSRSRRTIGGTIALLVSLFVLANAFGSMRTHQEGEKVFLAREQVAGPYNASIERWQYYSDGSWSDFYKIVYNYNGSRLEGAFDPSVRPALDWIKTNTSANATILTWWDYGHMIRGYTGRSSVIYYPSQNLINTVADKNSVKQFEPEERVKEVAETLISVDPELMRRHMQNLGAGYVLTAAKDATDISWAIFEGAGLNPHSYLTDSDGRQTPNEKSRDMFIFRIWSDGGFNGTVVDYADICSKVVEPS